MARFVRLESRVSTRAAACLLTAALHVGLLVLIVLSGGRRDGVDGDDSPVTRIVFFDSRVGDRSQGAAWDRWHPAMPTPVRSDPPDVEDIEPPSLLPIEFDAPHADARQIPQIEVDTGGDTRISSIVEPLATFVMPQAQASSFVQRIEREARELAQSSRTRVKWEQDGKLYDAELVLEPARDGIEPDRVVAQISAEDQGRQFRTRLRLKRLPFSYYAKFVDRWDPMVELHADEIVGRMHINSRFQLLHDSQAMPVFLGKVTTAAGGFNMRSLGRKRASDVFREGIETHVGRIPLFEQGQSIEQARRDKGARLHELAEDTGITFFADGRYALHGRRSDSRVFVDRPAGKSVYFIAARDATVYVQGVVAGRFLVYSPRKIVVEGNLVYARDPREYRDSDDYLGLVCDKDIEVAPPRVTGPGDLHIQAALYAKRRMVVADFEHPRSATLRIFGSVAAGTLTASEPRYATQVDYDPRFERLRPPGFPSTDRFAAEDWDGSWTVVSNDLNPPHADQEVP
jgi:hypothetical protein